MCKIAFNKSAGDTEVTPLFSDISFYSLNSFMGPRPQPLPSLTRTFLKPTTLSPLHRVSLAVSRHPRKQTEKITVILGLEINPMLP